MTEDTYAGLLLSIAAAVLVATIERIVPTPWEPLLSGIAAFCWLCSAWPTVKRHPSWLLWLRSNESPLTLREYLPFVTSVSLMVVGLATFAYGAMSP